MGESICPLPLVEFPHRPDGHGGCRHELITHASGANVTFAPPK